MKLLLDENRSPSLAKQLADLFPGTRHVEECGLGTNSDTAVWEYAKANGFVIASKDSDFEQRVFVFGAPPNVIWLRVGNCSTAAIEQLCEATPMR